MSHNFTIAQTWRVLVQPEDRNVDIAIWNNDRLQMIIAPFIKKMHLPQMK